MTIERLRASLADRYRIDRELGQGGMATVYLAEDLKHHRKVAIKVLREDLAASMGSARFLREIEIAAQLQHPNILPLLDSGDADGFLYYVMPYVTGQSLRERLAREGELPVHEAVRLISEVVDALAYAHEHGVVHRDIKPDNVMISGRHALVADFGVAKAVTEATGRSTVTTLGVAVGTPAYMSPEQAAADPHIDQRSDIYAVGAMAYELLTGRPPFVGATPQQVLAAHVTEAPDSVAKRRPGISPALEAVIMRCLAKRPADRWQTAGDLHAALEPIATPSGGVTPTHTQPVRAVRMPRRLPWIAAAVVVVAVVAVIASRLMRGRAGSGPARTVAVLPFDNASRDTAFDYLADGIANDIRSGLMKLPGLSVKARTSSEAAKGKPLHEAGTMLNVGVVLQGTFRHAADKTTVTVDLVNVSDETALWTASYVLPADGNFASAQDSITAAVAQTLHIHPPAGTATALAQRGTSDPEAYDLFLKGQHFFAVRGAANMRRAIDYYKQAIARDSNFARAYAGLSMLLTVYPFYVQASGDSIVAEAGRLARRALAIDPTLADGHLALASVLTDQQQPAAAEPEYLAAEAADPRSVSAHQWHGDNLALLARGDEAIREGRMSVDLDPLSAVAANDLAYTLLTAGQFDEAVRVARRSVEIDSTLGYATQYLGLALAFAGKRDSSQLVFERFFQLDSTVPFARAAHVWEFALGGRWPEAERELATLERTIIGGSRDLELTIANVALGNRAAALDAIERAAGTHSFYAASTAVGCDPTFDPLKSEPRFIAAVKQMGQVICLARAKWPIPARTRH
jgi:TolB-like protein/tRNA A-37 threonylcarbamoyl transferase component Bud32/Flp pilus assembly protein TadD